jgi:hypothetical protein
MGNSCGVFSTVKISLKFTAASNVKSKLSRNGYSYYGIFDRSLQSGEVA